MWWNNKNHIQEWRKWRMNLETMSLDDAILDTAIIWGKVPTVTHYLSPDDPSKWPNPWELINDNHYCDLSICLGMFYSLALSHDLPDIKINIYNFKDNLIHACVVGKYATNINHSEVINILSLPDQATLTHQYKKVDLSAKLK